MKLSSGRTNILTELDLISEPYQSRQENSINPRSQVKKESRNPSNTGTSQSGSTRVGGFGRRPLARYILAPPFVHGINLLFRDFNLETDPHNPYCVRTVFV